MTCGSCGHHFCWLCGGDSTMICNSIEQAIKRGAKREDIGNCDKDDAFADFEAERLNFYRYRFQSH